MLIIETLVSSIRCNNNIGGIHIPNTHNDTKLVQYADDCSIISTDISDYHELIKEFKIFGQVSGSKINEQKTEILKIGNPETINHSHIHQLVNDKVKVLGIWLGKNHKNANWLQMQNKVKIQLEKWRDRRLSLKHKVLIINTYILSKVLYVARIVPPSAKHIQIINRYIYTMFWGGNFEYLQRKSLIQPFCNGGQQVPDIQTKINPLIQTIGTHNTIKTLYLKYKENIILENKTVKDIYLQLLELDKLTHKVELNYSYIDFKPIWTTLCLVNTLYISEFIYKTIHVFTYWGKNENPRYLSGHL
jgi:hypothetical protein